MKEDNYSFLEYYQSPELQQPFLFPLIFLSRVRPLQTGKIHLSCSRCLDLGSPVTWTKHIIWNNVSCQSFKHVFSLFSHVGHTPVFLTFLVALSWSGLLVVPGLHGSHVTLSSTITQKINYCYVTVCSNQFSQMWA